MTEPGAVVSELLAIVLGAAPGMKPRRTYDEVADEMIDAAEFLESMGYHPFELRPMATRWRWGEPSRPQYEADVAWLRRQSAIAFDHMKGDTATPLMTEPVEHIDLTRADIDNPRNSKANAAHAAHASRRTPEYQLKVLEQRWEASVTNARALVGDAAILAEAKRLPRAFALAYLAIEELAKTQLLITAGLQIATGETVDYGDLERDLRNHDLKWSTAAMGMLLSELGAIELDTTASEGEQAHLQAELTARLSARPLRESALYSDYRHGQITEPGQIVDQGLVDAAVLSGRVWLADLSTLVDGLRGVAAKYSSPEFRGQIVEAATAWHRQRTGTET